jgi:hypothetical protein
MFRGRGMIGLSVSDRLVQAAELSFSSAGKTTLKRVAELTLPADAAWSQPQRAGQELLRTLRENRFSARRAIIGLPARWLLVRGQNVPITDEQTMAQTLRLQAEHEFESAGRNMVFDYVPPDAPPTGSRGMPVLLVATLGDRLRQVVAAAQAAGLEIVAVTSTVSAIASMQAEPADRELHQAVTLHLGRSGSEMMLNGSGAGMIRHLSGGSSGDGVSVLASEVRRVLSLGGDGQNRRVTVWGANALRQDHIEELSRAFGSQVAIGELPAANGHSVTNGVAQAEANRFVGSIALAKLGEAGPERIAPDFLHSRLAEPKRARFSRRMVLGAAAALVLLAGIGFLVADTLNERRELHDLQARLVEMEPDIASASRLASDVTFARAWFEERPRYLEIMRELTLALPDSPPMWVTNLSLYENRRGLVAGRTMDQRNVLHVLDRLQESGRFSDLQLLDMREAGRGASEVAFSISFRFVGREG